MKKTTLYLFALLVSFWSLAFIAQNELLSPTQTTYLGAWESAPSFASSSAINDNYYVLISSNSGNGNAEEGTYLKIYSTNNNLGTSLTPGILNKGIKVDGDNISVDVEIDNNDNIYVLCKEYQNNRIVKYNINGVVIETLQLPDNNVNTSLGQYNEDISVAANGDVLLVARIKQNNIDQEVKVFSYDSGLNLLDDIVVSTSPNSYSACIDMNENKFVVGIDEFFSANNYDAHFYKYNYNPNSNNVFMLTENHIDFSSKIYRGGNEKPLALRQNGDIFYSSKQTENAGIGGYHGIKKINGSGVIEEYSEGDLFFDVDIADRVITCGEGLSFQTQTGGPTYYGNFYGATIKSFNVNDVLEFTVDVGNEIKNDITSLCIYDCKFVVAGTDQGPNIVYNIGYSYEAFHQMFDCYVCDIPNIDLPNKFKFCNNNFQPICVPNNGSNYLYTWEDAVGNVLQSSNNNCFTPTSFGFFTVVVTDKYGCEQSHTFKVEEKKGPKVNLNDVEYCKDLGNVPSFIGFNFYHANAQFYSWTHNGNPIIGTNGAPTGPQLTLPFYDVNQGYINDGTYCVTVTWNDDCESEACFDVYECCGMPDADFDLQFNQGGISVQNNPNNTFSYSSEEFVLYEKCKGEPGGWTEVAIITRTNNFNIPVSFAYKPRPGCTYKVVHRVWSDCYKQPSISVQFLNPGVPGPGGNPQPIIVYPNPSKDGLPVNIEMSLDLGSTATVEIINLITGERVLVGELEYGKPIVVDYDFFNKSNGSAFGIYNIKVYNNNYIYNEKLIFR